MVLKIEQPFTPTRLQEERDDDTGKVFTIRMNDEELKMLEEAGRRLQQEKIGSVVKQLVQIGLMDVLHDKKTSLILEIAFKNKRRNERLGINIASPSFTQK